MKQIYTSTLLLISLLGFSQNKFEKGYFIDNSGIKINCLIKNFDWEYNPESIEIKKTMEDEGKEIGIYNIQEFSIDGISKYIKQTLNIDDSKGEPNYSISKEPHFVSSTVLLKVLVEGKNSLYSYENNQFPIRFFYKTEQSEIEQLICKKYFEENNYADVFVNYEYKKQLFLNVKADVNNSKNEKLPYKLNDLIDYFITANKFQGDTNSKEIQKRKKTATNYKLVLNTNFSHFDFKFDGNIPFDGSNTTDKNISFGYGFEVEIILPFNNNNWSIFIEPTYNTYSGTGVFPTTFYINPNYTTGFSNENYTATIKYNYIQIPLGIKRNIILNKQSKLNIHSAVNMQFSNNSKVTIFRSNNSTYLDTELNANKFNLLIGLGYAYKKFELELKQFSNLNVNPFINKSNYSYRNVSLSLKYKIN